MAGLECRFEFLRSSIFTDQGRGSEKQPEDWTTRCLGGTQVNLTYDFSAKRHV